MPHTHYTKGKTVWLRLKDGREFVGKFVERKGRFVVLDCGKFTTDQLAAMSYRKHQTTEDLKRAEARRANEESGAS